MFITVPGAIDAWWSLITRFSGQGAGVTISFGSASELYRLGFPLLGLAVLLFGIWWTRPKRGFASEKSTDGISKEISRSANWLYYALRDDPEHLDLRILFRQPLVYWHGVGKLEPYLELRIYIANRTRFHIVVDRQVSDGYLHYNGQSLINRAEIRTVFKLPHASEDLLTIFQSVSKEIIQDLSSSVGNSVVFDLSNLRFMVQSQFPDDSPGPHSHLKLPSPWKVKVPERLEWATYFDTNVS